MNTRGSRMNFARNLCRWIDALNRGVGYVVAWAACLVVLVVFADVVMRYAFNTSYVFVQEMEWHLFSFIFLIGAGYTLLKDGHVRVDLIYQRLSPKAKAWINFLGVLLFLIPFCSRFRHDFSGKFPNHGLNHQLLICKFVCHRVLQEKNEG